jgi:hypothetical protein
MNLLLVTENVECTAVKFIVDHVEKLILDFTAASRRTWLNTADCTTLFNIDVEDIWLITFQALLVGSCSLRTSKTMVHWAAVFKSKRTPSASWVRVKKGKPVLEMRYKLIDLMDFLHHMH